MHRRRKADNHSPEKRYLDHQQVQELAVASGRFRTLMLVLAYCGLRFGEAVALRRRDVDLDEARIWVTKSATHVTGEGIVENNTTKRTRASSRAGSGTDRKVPIPASVVELLRTELPTDPDALVFPGRKGRAHYLPLGELRWTFDKGLGAVRSEADAKRPQEIEETGKATTKESRPSPRMSFGTPARHWRSDRRARISKWCRTCWATNRPR